MGLGPSLSVHNNLPRKESEMFDINDENGYLLCEKYLIPEEVLSIILSHLPPKELVFSGRRVCKYWCNVIDSLVWKLKLQRINVPPSKVNDLPWYVCYWILHKAPLGKNLVRNNCGQEKLQHWDILSCGGDGWEIEKPPAGCNDFPVNEETSEDNEGFSKHKCCFSTSYYSCSKKQLINLKKEGIYSEFLDVVQPQITVGEWCNGRYDCSSIYELKVKLLNENYEAVSNFEVRKNLGRADGSSWQKVSHVFQNYGPGVKFIEFYHGGMDSQFWKGHYGSKMTGALVIISTS